MKTSVLGKTNKPQKKGKNLLDPIMRNKDSIKHGIDIWNVYDFMYLDTTGIGLSKYFKCILTDKTESDVSMPKSFMSQ